MLLDVLGSDSVEDSATLRRKNAGVELERISLLVLLDKFELLQLLQSPSDDLGGGVLVSLAFAFSSQESSVKVGEESDTGMRAQVDFAGKRGDSNVDPVLVEGGVFLT